MTIALWIGWVLAWVVAGAAYLIAEKLNRQVHQLAETTQDAIAMLSVTDQMLQETIVELAEHDRGRAYYLARQRDAMLELILD